LDYCGDWEYGGCGNAGVYCTQWECEEKRVVDQEAYCDDPVCTEECEDPVCTEECDEPECYPEKGSWVYRACHDYNGMKFTWNIRGSWVVQPRPVPVSGGAELTVDKDGNMPASTIIAGVPTKTYLWYSGVAPYVTGVIHVQPGGGDTHWPIWFLPGPDGRFYLCNAEKGVFPGFWVDGGLDCQ